LAKTEGTGGEGAGAGKGKDLELVVKTLTNLTEEKEGKLLLSYKAKEIVSEALTGFSRHEIEQLEGEVENILLGHVRGKPELVNFLDNGLRSSIFDLNKKSATRLADKLEEVIDEIKILQKQEEKVKQGLVPDNNKEVKQIRQYLFDVLDIKLNNPSSLQRINEIIKDRLAGLIDRTDLRSALDLPLNQGGAGLDVRTARKMARRLELLIKGKI
jgi:Ribonuclease G/E